MAIKIYFDNKNYSIEESAVSSAADNLKTHLSSVMNGYGAKIKLCENYYDIDTAKLSNATNDFISNLETVSGSGFNVVVGGAEHSIDFTKVSGTIYDLHAFFDSIRAKTFAGLYKPGAIDLYNKYGASAIEDMLITSWEDLVANGNMVVTDGEVSIGTVALELPEKNEYGFYFDVTYTAYDNGMTMGIAFHEDGSLDMYTDGSLVQSAPAGSAIYSADSADLSSGSMGVGTFSNGGISLGLIGHTFELTLASQFSPAGDLILPNDGSITSLVEAAFKGCSSLTSVVIPDSVTSIVDEAFSGCTSLTSITIPDNVTTIGEEAFYDCSLLASVTIPSSVIEIGNYAFQYCSSLSSITIPDGVTTIGSHAFNGCSSLTSVEIPDSVTDIASSTFSGCSNLITEYEFCQYVASGENPYHVLLNATKSMNTYTIHEDTKIIASMAFYRYTKLTSIMIPNSVISICDYAFDNCTSLTSVEIGNSVTTIGYEAFSECSSLTSVVVPDSVTAIGGDAFKGCSSLTEIIVNELNKTYCSIDGAMYNREATVLVCCPCCKTSITIPDSVTTIGNYAFYDCIELASITIPDSVTTIGDYAFYGCSSLTSVEIPDGVTTIGNYAFNNCTSLTSVEIPDSVTTIGRAIFAHCSSLTYAVIQCGVTVIDKYAFQDCTNLESIVIPSSVSTIDEYAFYRCKNLTNIYYTGTATQWNAIVKNDYWASGTPSDKTIHYNYSVAQ